MGRVLVGFDGSPPSRRALDEASRRAASSGDELLVATVIPAQVRGRSLNDLMPAGLELPPLLSHTFEEGARLRLDDVAAQLGRNGVKVRTEVLTGDTAAELLGFAERVGASEIFIGHKSYENADHVGPNARSIRDGAKVPVHLVR